MRASPPEKLILTACGLLFVIGLLSVVVAINFPQRLGLPTFNSDGLVFMHAVRDYARGQSLYFSAPPPPGADLQPYLTRFLYPPVAVWVLFPFFAGPAVIAGPLWMVVTCLLFLAVAFDLATRLARALDLPAPVPVAAAVTLTLGLWYPFVAHLGMGQVDVLVLALCYYAAVARQRRPGLAALALALATGVKLFPVLLVVYLLIADRGRARRFLAAYGLIIAGIVALAWLGFGAATFREWLAATAYHEAHVNTYLGNQSVIGTLARLLGPEGARGDLPLYLALKHAVQVLAPLAGGLALWLLARRRAVSAPALLGVEALLSAFVMAYVLASPLFWIQSHVILLPVFFLLAGQVLGPSRRGPALTYLLAGLLIGAMALQFTAWFAPPATIALPGFDFLLYHRYVLSQLMLAAALVLCLPPLLQGEGAGGEASAAARTTTV